MLKRLLLPVLLCGTLLPACKSDDSNNVTPTSQVRVDGLADVNVARGRTTTQAISISTTGTQEATTLSLRGLPAGVTAALSTTSGTPTFTCTITFTAEASAIIGTASTVTLTATTPDGLKKEYTFKVTVVAPTECTNELTGVHNATNSCGGPSYSVIITPHPNNVNTRVDLDNLSNNGMDCYADLDCGARTLIIPSQASVNGWFISGTGSWTTTQMQVSVTYKYSNGTLVSGNVCTHTISL
jgi:hypothetical protein